MQNQNEYIDTIVLMAYKMQMEDPNLSDDEAIKAAVQSFKESHKELEAKLTKLKERLSEKDWKALVEIFTAEKKSPEQLEASYNQKLNNNEFINGSTITDRKSVV